MAARYHGVARRAAADAPQLFFHFAPRFSANGAIHAATHHEWFIGGIHNGIERESRDVGFNRAQAFTRAHSFRSAQCFIK